jgi:hypothetical protein
MAMATDDLKPGRPDPASRNTRISGNNNSGFIAGGDLHLGNAPLPPGRAQAAEPTPAAPVLRILFLGSSPEGTPGLRLDQEVREIDAGLRQAEFRDQFDLRQQHAVRINDLQPALLRHRPQIVHFSGHGQSDGLYLEDETGQSRKVPGSVVARILGVFKKQIRCVVLNACYSKDQAEEIAKDIDCVVGMSSAVDDRSAIRFSSAFYQALAFGESVEMAFNLGCAQVDLAGLGEGNLPQLIASRRDPGEIVFVEAPA